jgi:hypothetical protein
MKRELEQENTTIETTVFAIMFVLLIIGLIVIYSY